MKAGPQRWVGLALVLCACGRLYEYPEKAAEQGAELCEDGADNDFDGRLDCDDSDCAGFCPEETLTECIDERDNDGDGLADADDPHCWLHASPVTQRCAQAEGADITDHFDVVPPPNLLTGYSWRWLRWGFDGEASVVSYQTHSDEGRQDVLVAFTGNTTSSEDLGANLGTFVRRDPFSGSWLDLELAFSAALPERALLRVGLVPVELAPSSGAPRPGAESALVSLTLDASGAVPVLAFDVEGLTVETELDLAGLPCDEDPCVQPLLRVSVVLDEEGLLARVTAADGESKELRAPAPSSLSLPPARLVFWGGSPSGQAGPLLDDLRANIRAELPCGIRVPQIPTDACGHEDFRAYGQSISLTRGEGEHCALVGVSRWDQALREGNGQLVAPDRITTWTSEQGDEWTQVSVLDPPEEGLVLVGAGISADDDGYHTAAIYRDPAGGAGGAGGADAGDETDPSTRLVFLDGESCDDWGSFAGGSALPADAEAPSYVIRDNQHEIYFSRPPTNEFRRTLWRTTRDDPDDIERVAELPPGVGQPVTVGLVGNEDLVLTYPTSADSGGKGVGLLVASADLETWQKVGAAPVLVVPPGPDLPAGLGRLGFDDEEVLAAALSWQPEGGFLLYSGRSFGSWLGADNSTPVLALGTARMVAAGQEFPEASQARAETCGDGECSLTETCSSCREDCPCTGAKLLEDVLSPETAWEISSSAPAVEAVRYLGTDPPALTLSGGWPTWSALELEQPIVGDFELSFDVLVERGEENNELYEPSQMYVGLGTGPEADTAGVEAPRAGAFALIAGCFSNFYPAPVAMLDGIAFGDPNHLASFGYAGQCFQPPAQRIGHWHHVELIRDSGSLRTRVVASSWQNESEGLDACRLDQVQTDYGGALPPLTHLLAGFGGGSFQNSSAGSDPVTVANLVLRLPDDPEACPEPKKRCDEGAGQPTCVDVSQSNEHCGGCGQACAQREICDDGACTCPGLVCDGTCVDEDTSLEHCGGCGQACDGTCALGICEPRPTVCSAPFEIPEAGGSFTLVLEGTQSSGFNLCGLASTGELVGLWTAPADGTAIIDLVAVEANPAAAVVDPVVAITTDTTCSTWLDCNHDVNYPVDVNSHLEFAVIAGVSYRIAVGVWDYSPYFDPMYLAPLQQATVELSILVE